MGRANPYTKHEITPMLTYYQSHHKHKAGLPNLAEDSGIYALVNQNRRVPNLKNRADKATERAVVEYAVEFPSPGQHRTSNELCKKGVFISSSSVCSSWQRHDLENFRKRLKALEEKIAREGISAY